jgi:hypothetical protein
MSIFSSSPVRRKLQDLFVLNSPQVTECRADLAFATGEDGLRDGLRWLARPSSWSSPCWDRPAGGDHRRA